MSRDRALAPHILIMITPLSSTIQPDRNNGLLATTGQEMARTTRLALCLTAREMLMSPAQARAQEERLITPRLSTTRQETSNGLSATKDQRIRMILPELLPLMVQTMSMSAATASDWGRVLIMPQSSMCRMRYLRPRLRRHQPPSRHRDRFRRLDCIQFRRRGRRDNKMKGLLDLTVFPKLTNDSIHFFESCKL